MTKQGNRAYSRYTLKALTLMAKHIKTTRITRNMTVQALADRAGISMGLLRRIENAHPSCSIGIVFEVASILGIALFNADYDTLVLQNKIIEEKLALLPSEVRQKKIEIDDNF